MPLTTLYTCACTCLIIIIEHRYLQDHFKLKLHVPLSLYYLNQNDLCTQAQGTIGDEEAGSLRGQLDQMKVTSVGSYYYYGMYSCGI